MLAVFTHAQHGEQDLLRIMRGFVVGLVAYALFCFALALSLESLSIAASFLLATSCALATQAVALTVTWRRREPTLTSPNRSREPLTPTNSHERSPLNERAPDEVRR